MPQARFQIGVWYANDYVISLIDYVELFKRGWVEKGQVDLKSSYLLLNVDEQSYHQFTCCHVEMMGLQFREVHQRLVRGEDAIIRPSIVGTPNVWYLLLEPHKDFVYISSLTVHDKDPNLYNNLWHSDLALGQCQAVFPFETQFNSQKQADYLYNYLIQHKEVLKNHSWKGREHVNYFTELAFPKSMLLNDLRLYGQMGLVVYDITEEEVEIAYY